MSRYEVRCAERKTVEPFDIFGPAQLTAAASARAYGQVHVIIDTRARWGEVEVWRFECDGRMIVDRRRLGGTVTILDKRDGESKTLAIARVDGAFIVAHWPLVGEMPFRLRDGDGAKRARDWRLAPGELARLGYAPPAAEQKAGAA